MLKGILVSSIVAATLIFSGCGSDSAGADRLKTQNMLDDGNYQGVISKLEPLSSLTSEQRMQLGNAYMGAAGLNLADLTVMLNSSTNTQQSTALVGAYANSESNNDYLNFLDQLRKNAEDHPKVLEYLDKAIASFKKVLEKSDKNTNAKLLAALSSAAKSGTSISYLGNIKKLVENGADDEIRVSACAMVYVYANKVAANCTVEKVSNNPGTSNVYKEIKVTATLNSGNYTGRRLTSSDEAELILSDGYVDGDGSKTTDSADGLNSANPFGDGNVTVQEVILNEMNEGFDSLMDIAPDDVKDDIRDFKNELDNNPTDGVVTSEELADYLTK